MDHSSKNTPVSSTLSSTSSCRPARRGKIARLPHFIREQLNRRLEDNEPGRVLVAWLNAQEQVQAVLAEEFGGRPITQQNLCEWRKGGYEDWQRRELLRASLRGLFEDIDMLQDETDGLSVADHCSEMQGLALARLLSAALAEPPSPQRERSIISLVRALNGVRRCDHARIRAAQEQERWDRERTEADEEKMAADLIKTQMNGQMFRQKYVDQQASGELSPETAATIRDYFTRHARLLRKLGISDLPPDPPTTAQGKSDWCWCRLPLWRFRLRDW